MAGLVLAVAMLAPAQGGGPRESVAVGPDLAVRVHDLGAHTLVVNLEVYDGSRLVARTAVTAHPGGYADAEFDLPGVGVYTVVAKWTIHTSDGPRKQTQELMLSTANCDGTDWVEMSFDAKPDANRADGRDTADMRTHC